MNILLLGSGGREHTLAWKLSKSNYCKKLFIAPGNEGTRQHGENVSLNPNDFESIGHFAISNNISLVVVGPEEPLVKGIFDFFKDSDELKHIAILGPSGKGAQLEGSKQFAKDFMSRYGIPTAAYKTFNSSQIDDASAFLSSLKPPYVIKANGLAAGKGVVIVDDYDDAVEEVKDMLLHKRFGAASDTIVIEEFLSGIELSVFVLTDGKNWVLLPEAKDYKRIGEKDTGLNTGGMGSLSPVPFADDNFMKKVKDQIIQPTINGLQFDNIDYRGFIFFGLISVNGDPFVIEYNVRLGDPETESVIPRITSDLVPAIHACANGNLGDIKLDIDTKSAATIMIVSGGYPGDYKKGHKITGLSSGNDNTQIFHAGTALKDGNIVTAGGRVIAVTSLAATQKDAVALSLQVAEQIGFTDKYYRKDIGFDIL
jgi:phosphoribosylamine---glycine ligase